MARDPQDKERLTPVPPRRQDADVDEPDADEREGATEREVGDRTGPGAGYDNEPEQERDRGGVS